jgi:hypothetical protein
MAYMLGFFAMGVGGVFMGWLADRTSPRVPLLIAGVSILAGGWLASSGGEMALYAGLRDPARLSRQFRHLHARDEQHPGLVRRARSTAVSIISVGPAISGFIWPQVYRWLLPDIGWRQTLVIYGVTRARCCSSAPSMCGPHRCAQPRRRAARGPVGPADAVAVADGLLSAAGFCCCAAMALPFVHMVAFCGDLGLHAGARLGGDLADPADGGGRDLRHGPARDFIGPLRVSILCALIQIASLLGFVFVDSLSGIYTLSVDARHSLHRHRPGLCPDPAPALWPEPSPAGGWAWSCCSPWPAWRSAAGWAAPSSMRRCPTARPSSWRLPSTF